MADARTYAMLKAAGDAERLAKANFNLFAQFAKAEEQDDGSIIVSGLCSSETKDSDGEIILASAIKEAIPEYMKWANVREMHSNIAAGKALSIKVNDAGETEFEARIINSETVKKVKEGVLQGFSIGGRKVKYNPEDRRVITGISLSEVSVVDRPANPDCRFQIAKFDGLQKDMYTVGNLAQLLQSIAWMIHSCQAEADMEGDNSTIPQKLREWLNLGTEVFGEMTEEETQELLVDVAGPQGMPLRGAEDKAASEATKAFKAHLLKRWASLNHGPEAVSKEAGTMADLHKSKKEEAFGAAKEDCKKSFKDVEETHKAHKEAAAAVHGLKDDASKEDAAKAMKDLEEAHKAHKDACDAHKDDCGKLHKAILGSVKDDSSKDDSAKDDSAKFAKLESKVADLTALLEKALATPAASPLELAIAKSQGKEALITGPGDGLPELDPNDPNYEMKKAMRNPR